ncbi:MAG: nicotinate-nucleotide diphosphorylase [Candidatus Omnitrophica bacterium]|nr:nicotinate-nucleotide diphosphorylase [Candidatus Omnitrophota bacterium]
MSMLKISNRLRSLIHQALHEDLGKGDITTNVFIPAALRGEAFIKAKAEGVLCGGFVVREVFRAVDPHLKVLEKMKDGARVSKGQIVLVIRGRVVSILKAERVALNFLSHLSGIATLTRIFVLKAKGTRAKIYDTRKTTPLWRELEKCAVKTGGGENHRFGLWDEVLVKDNHWRAMRRLLEKTHCRYFKERLVGAGLVPAHGRPFAKILAKSVRTNLAAFCLPEQQKLLCGTAPLCGGQGAPLQKRRRIPVEVEVESLAELVHLLEADVRLDRILLDNFAVSDLKKAVLLVRKANPEIKLEASGGITLKNVKAVAQTGVHRISIGALTHSASSLDFSLVLSKLKS